MAWSPDQEVLAIATNNRTILIMTSEWDVLYEVSMLGEDGDAPNTTAAASPSTSVNHDGVQCRLTWRGDGQFFACIFALPGSPQEFAFRVWDRNGQMQAKSEPCDRLSGLLSWRPTGAIIASSVKRVVGRATKHEIVFFERNGLRHGEFSLPIPDCEVLSMEWSADSQLLAVGVRMDAQVPDVGGLTFVQVWHRRNYHWYLKQNFLCGKDSSDLASGGIRWDPENPMKLVLVLKNSHLRSVVMIVVLLGLHEVDDVE